MYPEQIHCKVSGLRNPIHEAHGRAPAGNQICFIQSADDEMMRRLRVHFKENWFTKMSIQHRSRSFKGTTIDITTPVSIGFFLILSVSGEKKSFLPQRLSLPCRTSFTPPPILTDSP